MSDSRVVFHQPCCALIDQGRYIGGDPVGHVCYNDAVAWVAHGGLLWPLCGDCNVAFERGLFAERRQLPNAPPMPIKEWWERYGFYLFNPGAGRDAADTPTVIEHKETQ